MRSNFCSTRLVTLVLLLSGAVSFGDKHDKVTKGFGGKENRSILTTADRVEVFRVDANIGHAKGFDEKHAAGFPIIAGPVVLAKTAANQFGATLNSDDTYQFEMFNLCMFVPGYVARFTKGAKVLEVALCFHCGDIQVVVDAKDIGYMSMMPGQEKLLAQLKPLFPDKPTTKKSDSLLHNHQIDELGGEAE
jgi:hypothetical protein